MRISFCSFSALLVLFFIPVVVVHAQTPCGSIIAPSNLYDQNSALITTPISNCVNPFNETSNDHVSHALVIEGQSIENGASVEVAEGGTDHYSLVGDMRVGFATNMRLFLHDGENYRFVSIQSPVIQESDYRMLALEYFGLDADVEPYVQAVLSGNYDNYSNDFLVVLFSFFNYVDEHFVPTVPVLRAGTYTLVTQEDLLILTKKTPSRSFFQAFLEKVIPFAYAQSAPNIFTFTFTLTEKIPTPVGASSVLFLPGIQSSSLSKNGVLGTDDQIWLPDAGNQDVQQLAMNADGTSITDVHTTGIISTLPFGGTVYDSFARFMVGLVHDGVIKGWTPFAYDWRISAIDVAESGTKYEEGIRSAVTEIEYLASSSYTGKVTIIGHSNGGLFAKALMRKLEEQGKSNLVDKVVFLATPQLGTPKAIGTVLHGYDQEKLGGWLIDDAVARDVIQNMPGAYGLIPSQKYFDTVTGPVVTFDTGVATQRFRNAYGTSVDSAAELLQFMTGSADLRPNAVTIDDALKANSSLLFTASEEHRSKLDSWVAPLGVEVIEVVGVGLDTVKSFEYQSFTEKFCTLLVLCHDEVVYKPVPHFSQYGDKTVMGQSAEAYGGEKKKYFVDLKRIADLDKPNLVEHYNISENPSVQTLIQNILEDATSTPSQFIATSTMQYSDDRILLGTHSPVTIEVTDQNGKQVKLTGDHVTEDIPGSSYTEIGDSKYVLVPANGTYAVVINGTANGGLTFSMDALHGETQTKMHRVQVATITPSTSVQVAYAAQSLSNLTIDTNGDGETDIVLTPNGVDVTPKITYGTLKTAVDGLSLLKVRKLPLQLLVTLADVFDKNSVKNPKLTALELSTLHELELLLSTYHKKGWITQSEYSAIIKIINKLK